MLSERSSGWLTRHAAQRWQGQQRNDPPPGREVGSEDLAPRTPTGRDWGFERGRSVDRCYLEPSLAVHACDLRGRVLEVGADAYTRRVGGEAAPRSNI